MDINDLRRMLKAAADAMEVKAKAIEDLEASAEVDATALAAAVAAFETAEGEFKALQVKVSRAEAVERAKAATATSELAVTTPATTPALPKDPAHEGIEVGFMAHALINSKGDKERAVARLEKDGYSGISAALSGADESAGGVTLPRPQAQQLIGLLRPRITVRNSGARVHDLPAGEIRNARMTSGAVAGYGAENAAMVESEPTFDEVAEKFNKLTTLVPIGNSLLRHSSASIAMIVRDDILREMGLKNDLAFLRFDGTGNTPKGLRHWALAEHWQAAVGNDAAVVEEALRRCVSQVEDADVGLVSPGWIMRASTKNFLSSLRTPAGSFMFPSIEQSGTLHGAPIRTTSQVPNNLGVGGDEAEVYFADFSEIMIGDSMQITLGSSTEASYVNQAGDTVSAFQNDLTLMRAIAEHDLAPAHDEAIAGLNGVGWSL